MIYAVNISTPKNTTQNSPQQIFLTVTSGLVYKVELHFPIGSIGLMGVIITDGSYQVWPSTLGQWFTGDNIVISFDDTYLKKSAPFDFQIYTYNTDDTYSHIVNVRLGMVSREIFQARFLPHLSYKYMIEAMQKLEQQQAEIKEQQSKEIIEKPFEWLKV